MAFKLWKKLGNKVALKSLLKNHAGVSSIKNIMPTAQEETLFALKVNGNHAQTLSSKKTVTKLVKVFIVPKLFVSKSYNIR